MSSQSPPARPDNTMAIATPFHACTQKENRRNHWVNWAGYTVPGEYTHTHLEYFAVRNQCGVFDLSPMIKYAISGAGAEAYLNRLCTRNIEAICTSHVAYVMFCNQLGHTLDDGTLFKFSQTDYLLCTQDRHLPWLLDSAIGFDVDVAERTEAIAALAVQGPTSAAVLKSLGLPGIEDLAPFNMRSYVYCNNDLIISRTGFTGDLGYELWLPPEIAVELWNDLFVTGQNHGIQPCGTAALEMLRIEAGFVKPGKDFLPANRVVRLNRGRSPFELGYGRFVDFDKGFFNGRKALLKEYHKGSRYKLIGLEIEGNKPANDAWVYKNKRKHVGTITSAMWSPSCKANIALAWLESGVETDNLWVDVYANKELKWGKNLLSCWQVKRPFFNPPRRHRVPAGEY